MICSCHRSLARASSFESAERHRLAQPFDDGICMGTPGFNPRGGGGELNYASGVICITLAGRPDK